VDSKTSLESESSGVVVVFFDGVCNLCNAFVSFLIRVDSQRILRYSSLQGKLANSLGLDSGTVDPTSVIVQDSKGSYLKESDAMLFIFSQLGLPWSLLGVFRILPPSLRDWTYRMIARNRYKIFGKSDSCRLPTPEERQLFID
jgi:predicted DCC family thiol-disulfide oxidoreductase YuxK